MKGILATLLLLMGMAQAVFAGDGYRIQVKFTDLNLKDSMVFLAHYYGKPLPTIYKADSARFDKNGIAVLESKENTLGGIYLIMLANYKTYFEFLLNNGDNMSITATAKDLPLGVVYKNSPENERFQSYVAYLQDYSQKQMAHQEEMAKAKTKTDSTAIIQRSSAEGKEVTNYRRDYIQKYPGTLLANIFNALEVPHVPEGKHYLPNGKDDTDFAYNYYKSHYWDKFDFSDDRLINTPLYDAKLDEYFNKVIMQYADSFEAEADKILAKARGHKEMFKYTLHTLAQYAQHSKVMGMDEAFVYLVENYYMKGDAYWLSSDMLSKYIDRARKIAPNVLGNLAPELKMTDIGNKPQTLSGVKSKYTLLVFWSPTCGACLTEIPRLDSVYNAVLKNKGVKVFAVKTDSDEKIWQEKIDKFGINDWVNVYDADHTSNYKSLYDVYGTPSIYLLDEKKIIKGKKLDHENIAKLIDMLESKDSPMN